MKIKQNTHMTDVLFTLALFCVFAASSLLVVLIGANVYNGTVERMSRNFDTRASVTYVFTKVKQNDMVGAVSLSEIEGVPALALDRDINGAVYRTWIYHHDGYLKEIFTSQDREARLMDGQSIVAVEQFMIERSGDNLYKLTSVDKNGRSVSVEIYPRCA